MTWQNIQYVNYMHKGLTDLLNKGKLANTKLLAPSLT